MWFELALRLAYPHTPVAGIYFYEDGKPAPGNNQKLKDDHWVCDSGEYNRNLTSRL